MVRIAVDAMGGDHAPKVVIQGALAALEQFDDLELSLVGPEEVIQAELGGVSADRLSIVHAPEVVGMHESPVEALRKKPQSSLRVMASLVKAQECDAAFSAGNTGAMVAAATMLLGLLPGVRRAGIAVTLPAGDRSVVLMDVGANVQPKPIHLFQYGLMAAEYSKIYGVEDPKVALLNIGSEDSKGNPLVKETRQLFEGSRLRFHGNVEGSDIFLGDSDVVVCDGFTGNIVLKTSEGLSEKMIQVLKQQMVGLDPSDALVIKKALGGLAAQVDYAEYGGAPLLGVNGSVVIGHGRSDAKAVSNALRWAREMKRHQVNEKIVGAIEATVV